ncbi:MAG: hypothetical protein FWG55_02210 [Candidatus Bathyarchaeota archaeon]|nr:hypothetical protein [Candidatus Termiticorpusculum sp.]
MGDFVMAVFYIKVNIIGCSSGRSATGAAAVSVTLPLYGKSLGILPYYFISDVMQF